MIGYVAPPPGLEQVAAPPKPRADGNQDAQLMAKALTDLYGRLPSADVARMTEILTGLAHGGGKLSTSDHTMLTQAIRQLEVEVATSVKKLSRPSPCQPNPDMFHSLSTTPSVSPQGNSPCDFRGGGLSRCCFQTPMSTSRTSATCNATAKSLWPEHHGPLLALRVNEVLAHAIGASL